MNMTFEELLRNPRELIHQGALLGCFILLVLCIFWQGNGPKRPKH